MRTLLVFLALVADVEARLVHAPDLGANGQPADRQTAVFSTPGSRGLNDGYFQTFGKSRGMGDCGTLVSYQLVASSLATIIEVRHQRCDYDGDPIIDSDEWPVVYRADG